ncbi:MAG: hypothetical protein KA712_02220 [Myxococcales bacterium]|nr:hypothetical protein [Myxococcales bacterium]
MSPGAIEQRIVAASALSDLRPERRLDAKLDMSPEGIAKRIQEASDLRTLCHQLAASKG